MAAKKTAAKKDEEKKSAQPAATPDTTPAPEPEPTPEVSRETASAAKPTKDDKKAVVVCDPHGNPHRTYSLEVHGEAFRELAEKYVSSRPGWSLK